MKVLKFPLANEQGVRGTALGNVKTEVPMVVRLLGTNAQEGMEILAAANMQTATTLSGAAQKAVAATKG